MEINTFTFIAQIINFLILIYLLYRFLYGPILNVMKKREEKIDNRLEEADQKKAEAQKHEEEYRQKLDELEDERDQRLAEIEEEVEKRRGELMEKARSEVEEQKKRWLEGLKEEQEDFLRDLRNQTSQQIGRTLRQALCDLADAELDQQVRRVFLKRLQDMNAQHRESIVEAAGKADEGIIVWTAETAESDASERIEKAIRKDILDGNDKIKIQFKRDPDMVAGIELQADGQRLSWSLQGYLDELEENIEQFIHKEISQETEAEETADNE